MKSTINGIPLYEAHIDNEELGMLCISLVDTPAVQSNFLAFDANTQVELFRVADEDKRIVRGVVMRANFPIYRRNEKMGEYYITFSAETIRTMAEKYLAEFRQAETTLHHIAGARVEGINLVQYFIKDSANGIAPVGFEDIEDGSLFAEFQVHDEALWEQIKCGTFKGFSLEGVFALERADEQPIVNKNKMSKKMKLKDVFAYLMGVMFEQVTTDKGVLRWETDGDLKEGDEVFHIDENGAESKPEDGDYKTEDGKIIRVVDGRVAEIIDDRAEVSEEGAEESTDETAEALDVEARILALEEKIAEVEARIAEAEARIADNRNDEAMSAIAELREAMSAVAPKGIAQTFEEQGNEVDKDAQRVANLVKLRRKE